MSGTYKETRALAEEIGRAIALEIIAHLRHGEVPVAHEFLTARQVAQMTSLTVKALETRRQRGDGPPFSKVGRSVRYSAAGVRAWIEGGAS